MFLFSLSRAVFLCVITALHGVNYFFNTLGKMRVQIFSFAPSMNKIAGDTVSNTGFVIEGIVLEKYFQNFWNISRNKIAVTFFLVTTLTTLDRNFLPITLTTVSTIGSSIFSSWSM